MKSIYTPEAQILGQLIRTVRVEMNLSQADVARGIGKAQSYISKIESGELMIDAVILVYICRAMDIRFSDFALRWERLLNEQVRSRDADADTPNYLLGIA